MSARRGSGWDSNETRRGGLGLRLGERERTSSTEGVGDAGRSKGLRRRTGISTRGSGKDWSVLDRRYDVEEPWEERLPFLGLALVTVVSDSVLTRFSL